MSKPKLDPAKKIIKLALPAPVVQLTLQALAAQPYNLVAAAIDLISKQYNGQRTLAAAAGAKKGKA